MVVLNSLSFCLSVKLLRSPSYLNEILAGYSDLGCRLFSFITLSMSCHSLLAWRVSIDRSAVILMGIPLYIICCFSLAAFNICSLCLILLIWLICVLGYFALGLSYLGLSLGFLDLGGYFLPHFREVFSLFLCSYRQPYVQSAWLLFFILLLWIKEKEFWKQEIEKASKIVFPRFWREREWSDCDWYRAVRWALNWEALFEFRCSVPN